MNDLIQRCAARMRLVAKVIIYRVNWLRTRPVWRRLRRRDRVWIELGSGAKRGRDGWVTVDRFGADITHDICAGIPLPEGCVDRIYASHVFEHIPFHALVALMAECCRVLKVGGELSVCVPDGGRYLRAYVEGRQADGYDKAYQPAVIDTGSMMDQVNYIAYMAGQHHYLFDRENLVNTLKQAPFARVELRPFDATLDLAWRDFDSIYARAIK